MTDVDKGRIGVIHAMESRDRGRMRMRFPADPDTTRRLERLRLDPESTVPWWRRLLRRLRGESGWQQPK